MIFLAGTDVSSWCRLGTPWRYINGCRVRWSKAHQQVLSICYFTEEINTLS